MYTYMDMDMDEYISGYTYIYGQLLYYKGAKVT